MPNRIIKDSIRTSKSVNTMTDFQFRLWAYLLTYVDDYGRGSADPELLKGFVFPRRKGVTETTIEKSLQELANIGSILLYEVDGESYFCFPNWADHQRIQSKKSRFPAPVHGESRKVTVSHGESPPESNPIQSNPNTNPNTNPNPNLRNAQGDFEMFWSAYPKKVGKQKAFDSFRKVTASLDVLLDAIEAQKQSAQWTRDNGQFIPYPATWLNGKRWEDQVEPQKSGWVNGNLHLGEAETQSIRRILEMPVEEFLGISPENEEEMQ